jgi:protoporphyrinogen oxidase
MHVAVPSAEQWCVVGGGLLGLTLALRLAEQGKAVTVLEAAPSLGGLASPWRLGDVEWDRHYHVTLLSDRHLRRVLDELGLDASMRWTITQTGFYVGGKLHRLNNAIDFLRFPPISLIGKVRLAATILYASKISDGRPLERIELAAWLQKLSGRAVFEQIWRPLLRAKLGDNYKIASAAFIWAVVKRLYAARQSGLKTEMFGYLPGGYKRILAAFAEHLAARGVRLELATPVERIVRDEDGLIVQTPAAARHFDRVVVTAPSALAARLCEDLAADERQRLNGIVYQGILCASVLLKRPLTPYYLTYITDEQIPFTAIVEMSALVDPVEFGGRGLIYLPKYVTADDPAWSLSDAEIEAQFLNALKRMHPQLAADDILCFQVSRVRHVLAISTLNYSDHLPPMITSVPGLAIVNSAHIVNGTLNVNETVALAESALPALLAADQPLAGARTA